MLHDSGASLFRFAGVAHARAAKYAMNLRRFWPVPLSPAPIVQVTC